MAHSAEKIVCLAKSRKYGGICLAGRQVDGNGGVGGWIRPVGASVSGEVSYRECRYPDNSEPDLLDVLVVPLEGPRPQGHQRENHRIDTSRSWRKLGNFHPQALHRLCDRPAELWSCGSSSYHGANDRVLGSRTTLLENSLFFVTPESLAIVVQSEGNGNDGNRRKVRAAFRFRGRDYRLAVTDRTCENRFLQQPDGCYRYENPENRVFLCVSMGLPFLDGYCYKFVASVIET